MRCREFALRRSDGSVYPLNGKDHGAYIRDPAGLGFSASPTFADLKGGFFVPTSDDAEPQQTFTGTIVFTKLPYQTYRKFAVWLGTAKQLELCYTPVPGETFYKQLSVNYISKGELNSVGWLEIPFSFYQDSPWYRSVAGDPLVIAVTSDENVRRYDYFYDEDLHYGEGAAGVLAGEIRNVGSKPGYLMLQYVGACSNPTIRITGKTSGTTYGLCSANTSLTASDRLYYSSRPDNAYLQKIAADGSITDLLDVIRNLNNCWAALPPDEPCALSLEADTPLLGDASVQIFNYWGSV